jgi:hypothetical protein
MPQQVKFLSWNIQKFGTKKATDPTFIGLIVEIIINTGANIVGIMEIVALQGDYIVQTLVSALNNAEGNNYESDENKPDYLCWKGIASEEQYGNPKEQYIFLWKETNNLKTTIDDFQLPGIVDDNLIKNQIPKQTDRDIFYDHLRKYYFINNVVFRIMDKKAIEIENLSKSVSPIFTPPLPAKIKNLNKNKKLAEALFKSYTPLTFPHYTSRPPYIGEFEISNGQKLVVILFHAPGPGNPEKFSALNKVHELALVKNANNAIFMGDFNIKASENKYACWSYDADNQKVKNSNGRGYETEPIFSPFNNNGWKLLDFDNTSYSSSVKSDGSYLANSYDKALVKRQITTPELQTELIDLVNFFQDANDIEITSKAMIFHNSQHSLNKIKPQNAIDLKYKNKIQFYTDIKNKFTDDDRLKLALEISDHCAITTTVNF